jgi:RNA polymerase sigma factor (sigma-70 family)
MSKARRRSKLGWIRSVMARYEGPLTRYAVRMTGDVETGRDIAQETFMRLCLQDPAEVDGHLSQWLFTVCRNKALDVQRKDRRMRVLQQVKGEVGERRERDPAQAAEQRDHAGRVLQLLALLPENQQEVIRLRFQESLSYKEIAAVTQLSVSNVGYLIHTAIKTIRARLQESERNPRATA